MVNFAKNTIIMNKVKLIGEIDSWGYTRYCLEYDLSQFPSEEPVMLEVDSLGGDVMEDFC